MGNRYDDNRTWRHLYNRKAWKVLRLHRLEIEPLCRLCMQSGRWTRASVVDHIKEHKGDEKLFFDLNNTQSLCKQCHDGVKQTQERKGIAPGNDASGVPLDSNHWWNK